MELIRRIAWGAALALAMLLSAAASASAAVGDLSFENCLSASTQLPPNTNDCTYTPDAGLGTNNTGFSGQSDVVASADGKALLLSGRSDSSLISFGIAADGTASLDHCVTADSNVPANLNGCTTTPVTAPDGLNTGLNLLTRPAISPDGTSVYLGTEDDASIVTFTRAASGALALAGCITADSSVPPGTNGCVQLDVAAVFGSGTGFDRIKGQVVSPDGENVYATSELDASVLTFDRAPGGALSLAGCLTADATIAPGVNGCTHVADIAMTGLNVGFSGLTAPAVSPDGKNLYIGARGDAAILTFDRAADGTITHTGCITADSNVTPGQNGCVAVADTASSGTNVGFGELSDPVVTPDGESVVMSTDGDASVLWFDRASNGSLAYAGCITADSDILPGKNGCVHVEDTAAEGEDVGFEELSTPGVSPDGRNVYLGSARDAALLSFDRDGAGDLNFASCFTADDDILVNTNGCTYAEDITPGASATGFNFMQRPAVSPDGAWLHVGTRTPSILGFSREPAPVCSNLADDDGDGKIDFPDDPGCAGADDGDETDPVVSDPDLELTVDQRGKGSVKKLKLEASCNVGCALVASGSGKLKGKAKAAAKSKKIKLKKDRTSAASGETVVLKLKAKGGKKKLRRYTKAIKRGQKAKFKLAVKATDAGGSALTEKLKVTVKKRKK